MKRIVSILITIILSISIMGCSDNNKSNNAMIASPINKKLDIVGKWVCDDYKILDKNVASNEAIFDVFAKDIEIFSTKLVIGEKTYNNIEYRLKLVKSDYSLSYEANDTIKELGIVGDNIRVYSMIYENSLLCELVYDSNKLSYLYYQGILFNIRYVKAIEEKDDNTSDNSKDLKDNLNSKSSQGLLLGLKVKNNNSNSHFSADYRTLWISTEDGEVLDIKSKKDIIVPRRNGIWKVQGNIYKDTNRNIFYEYFDVKPLDTQSESQMVNSDKISEGKIVKKQINYVCNDYISLEIENNEKFSQSPIYSFIPMDNINTDKSMVINDFYGSKDTEIFENNYKSAYYEADSDNKSKLAKNINYSNFTLVREEGHWILQGRISPILGGGTPVDYDLDFKPNKLICNYDILTVPWRVLKSEVPFLVDAFTSPDGSLVVIRTEEELLVYTAKEGKLANEPSKRIVLKSNESVIMTEWCEKDYVSKWATAFNKGSTIVG